MTSTGKPTVTRLRRRGTRYRAWILAAAGVVGLPVMAVLTRTLLVGAGMSGTASTVFGVVIASLFGLRTVLLIRLQYSGWLPRRPEQLAVAMMWSSNPGVAAMAVAAGMFGASLAVAGLVGMLTAVAFFTRDLRQITALADEQTQMLVQVRTVEEADGLIARCRRRLAGPLEQRHQPAVEANLAWGLTQQALLADRPEGLDEALALVRGLLLRQPELDQHLLWYVASTLVEIVSLQTERHGDDSGYEGAVKLLEDLTQKLPDSNRFLATVLEDQADHLLHRGRRAGLSQAEALTYLTQTEALLRRALELVKPRSLIAAGLMSRIALAQGLPVQPDAVLDDGVDLARRALALCGRRHSETREWARSVLATLLLERSGRSGSEADLDKAQRLCQAVVRHDCGSRHIAYEVLAGINRIRGRHGATLKALREAFTAQLRISVADASWVAHELADAAVEIGDEQTAAEAYWQLVTQVPREVARRTDPAERDRLVAAAQGIAAEAGYWLARVGRVRDAVKAIESSRAILLSQRLRRLPEGLVDRLPAELHTRYRRAVRQLEHLDQRSYFDSTGQDTRGQQIIVDGVRYRTGELSRAQRAWSEYHRVRQEVEAVLGGAPDVPPVPDAARVGATLVYLAAAQRGGYALVLSVGQEPVHLPMPELHRTELEKQATLFAEHVHQSGAGPKHEVLQAVLGWLWSAAMGGLVSRLPRGSEVVLVPLGALGALPLHAAAELGEAGGEPLSFVCDHVAVRYAPNAQLAAAARLVAVELDRRPQRALAAAAGNVAPHPKLPYADAESVAIARRYGSVPVVDASRSELAEGMAACGVWHLACHGQAVSDQPLESTLYLKDGRLTLREVLTWPTRRHRLAVLSACESQAIDPAQLDEVIGFPSGLMQAGVAGVLASQWKVKDEAAYYLTLWFHDLWRAGQPPAVALANAQRWLRRATNAELMAAFGADYLPPLDRPVEALSDPRFLAERWYSEPENWAAFSFTGA